MIPQHVFRAYDVRGLVGVDLTPEFARGLGLAIAAELVAAGAVLRCCVGYDARDSGPELAEGLIAGLTTAGVDVDAIGLVATPHLYHATVTTEAGGGVMITGSHNPSEYNGFKIMVGPDSLHGEAIQRLYRRMVAAPRPALGRCGAVRICDALTPYAADLAARLEPLARPMTVVVDAGNGCGGLGVPVLEALGARVIPLFCEPDPAFPNHHPDPTVEANLQHLIAAVAEHRADFGVAFDGDVDRIGVVDENGGIIWGDMLTLLFAREVLKTHPGAVIIGEVKCSESLYEGIAAAGGQPLMWKAGHSLIKAQMKALDAPLAGEMSGHIFFADRYYGFDDAIYAAGRLLALVAAGERPLSQLLADVPPTFSTPEIRRDCAGEAQKFALVRAAEAYFSERYECSLIDGVRVQFEGGWGLVRASNTQPILVLRFEAQTAGRLAEIKALVEDRLSALEAAL
jgi:phosphomannomutase/phosphoglucomutase